MNEASRWRLEMARAIAPVYTTDPRVRAVIVAGSVARGFADAYSDVEIGVFWEEFPAPEELQVAMERSRGTAWELDPHDAEKDDVWYEEYAVDGLKIDLRHMTAARLDQVLTAVIEAGPTAVHDDSDSGIAVESSRRSSSASSRTRRGLRRDPAAPRAGPDCQRRRNNG